MTLTGHSLGASIATSALAKSKSIHDIVSRQELGHTKEFNEGLSKSLSKDDKKVLKEKLTHHHTKNGVISTALTDREAIGRVKKMKRKTLHH